MKKIILVLFSILVSLALFSCSIGDGSGDGGSGGNSDSSTSGDSSGNTDGSGNSGGSSDSSGDTGESEGAPEYIFKSGDEVYLVSTVDISESCFSELSAALSSEGITLKRGTPDESHIKEIVVGRVDREISAKAYARLARIDESEKISERPYIIYSSGESLAIAYEGEALCAEAALSILTEKHLIGGVTIYGERGTVRRGYIDVIAEYRRLDAEMLSLAWSRLSEEGGTAISASMSEFYTIYSDELIVWFANLYDPAVGGYYFSNSARDNEGYLPDADSTYQALNFISSSGMAYTEGEDFTSGSYADVLPESMKAEIIAFIKSLQVPDGYFYHPQWGKKLTDLHPSRRARDLSRSVSVLKALGASPTYDTPSGIEGDGIMYDGEALPVSFRSGNFRSGVTAATARAVAASSVAIPAYLKNKDSFTAHLASLDIISDSYSVGHDLVSAMNEIKYRDEVLKKSGANYSLVDILISWLNSKQLENGLWSESADYAGTNGLMKISGVYSSAGVPIPRAREAAAAAMANMTTTELPDAVTDVYNTWAAMNRILSSLSGKETTDLHGELLTALRENAPTYISATKAKLVLFAKSDGSFSYNREFSSSTSQGVPSAVPGSREGDVNAAFLCSSDVVGVMYSALDLPTVPIYTRADMQNYLLILESLGAVIKNEGVIRDIEPVTFDDEKVGSLPSDITASVGSGNRGGHISVERDPRGEDLGNILHVISKDGGKEEIIMQTYKAANKESCFVFEGDFCIKSMSSSYSVQMFLDDCYMLTLRKKNGRVSIVESSSNSAVNSIDQTLKAAPAFGEWFNLKIEYYPGSASDVRIKLYVNGNLAAVTDNYYDKEGAKLTGKSTPKSDYTYFKIQTLSSAVCEFSLDNLNAYRTSTAYEAITDPTKTPALNVDCPSEPIKVPTSTEYRFDGKDKAEVAHDFYGSSGERQGGLVAKDGTLTLESYAGRDGFGIENVIARPDYEIGTTYYFETDFTYVEGTPTGTDLDAAFVGLLSNNDEYKNGKMFAYGYLSFADAEGTAVKLFGNRLERGVRYRIRIEYTVGDGSYSASDWKERHDYVYANMRLYINGEEAPLPTSQSGLAIGLAESGSDTHLYGFGIYTRGGKFESLKLEMSNTVIGSEPPSKTPEAPDEPDTPDTPDTPDEPDTPDTPDTPDVPVGPIIPPDEDMSNTESDEFEGDIDFGEGSDPVPDGGWV